jgi:hypothetical protein
MLRLSSIAIGLSLWLNVMASSATAQWGYPSGYGGYGMSRWGQDPAAGYMAGLGSFARGQGEYQLEKAQADAINVDTMAKWNKALRARQLALREDHQKDAAKRDRDRERRVDRVELEDGTTLNNLLAQIFDIDPVASKSSRYDSPFEWDSEAVTLCLDQMTGKDSLPAPLMAPEYADDRNALHAAIEPALEEDAKGSVSAATRKHIGETITKFRAKFMKNAAEFQPGYDDALGYFTTMAGLSRLLNDPSMKAFLAALKDNEERSVGNLIAFMNSHNLRFGPTTSDRQVAIYKSLVPLLTAIRDHSKTDEYSPSPADRSGEGMKAAAKDVFKPMRWDQLETHAKNQ